MSSQSLGFPSSTILTNRLTAEKKLKTCFKRQRKRVQRLWHLLNLALNKSKTDVHLIHLISDGTLFISLSDEMDRIIGARIAFVGT